MMEVLDRSPWSFDRKLILLKHFNGDLSSGNVSFQYSPFWIRVLNIPIKSINKAIGNYTIKDIGVLLLVDAPKSGLTWGPFLRIRWILTSLNLWWGGKWSTLKTWMRVGSILSMRGCRLSVIDVVYWVIKIANVSKLIKDASIPLRMSLNLVHGCIL